MPLKFDTRFVAFIDLLGFKNLIERIENSPDSSRDQMDILSSVLDFLKAQQESGTYASNLYYQNDGDKVVSKEIGDIKSIAVSDCLVMSAQGDFEGFRSLAGKIVAISADLAIDGLFLRGAITRGNLYHQDGILFGSAYQKAVELEKEARNPCIIIDHSATSFLNINHSNSFPFSFPTIRDRVDGYKYLSYFPYKVFPPYVNTWSQYLREVKKHILANLALNDSKTIQKYLWLKDEFNFTISQYKNFIHKDNEQVLDDDLNTIE